MKHLLTAYEQGTLLAILESYKRHMRELGEGDALIDRSEAILGYAAEAEQLERRLRELGVIS